MSLADLPFGRTDWSLVEATEHPGETGVTRWRTRRFGHARVRMVEYSAGAVRAHAPSQCDSIASAAAS